MKKIIFKILSVLVVIGVAYSLYAQSTNSLHFTRKGKSYFYASTNGGFETMTNIPMTSLRCLKCHPKKLADGTPIDTNTYAPSCNDCHNFSVGNAVPDSICFRCHSRQGVEKSFYTDKHRSAGMACVTCHIKEELHADGTNFNTQFDTTMGKTCETSGCHNNVPVTQNDSLAHATHTSKLECATCHSRSQITCDNCHFETELWSGMRGFKRFVGKSKDFIMLGRNVKKGKVGIINYQSLTYQGQTFLGYGPYYAHTIMPKDSTRGCSECHSNAAILEYNTTNSITVTKWDTTVTPNAIVHTPGVIPIPHDDTTSLKFDFANYTGRVDTTYTDPTKWVFLKHGLDGQQMLSEYVLPLTAQQMQKLGATIGIKPIGNNIPDKYELLQNYPNPFNPVTMIQFYIPKSSVVTLKVYNILGKEVFAMLDGQRLNAGVYQADFDGSNFTSGVYFYRLETPDFAQTLKMVLIK